MKPKNLIQAHKQISLLIKDIIISISELANAIIKAFFLIFLYLVLNKNGLNLNSHFIVFFCICLLLEPIIKK